MSCRRAHRHRDCSDHGQMGWGEHELRRYERAQRRAGRGLPAPRVGIRSPAASRRPVVREALCLLPGFCGFIGYALYPALTRSQAALDPVERLGAPLSVENADVMVLIAGIVT